ncbi:uncharacterized protein OCT59_013370 [Rhizophagus irregularis]|uniref:Uncharacterized protein n=2 Tax=Rhizophagus irregularis TaxID=588596 RepID=U9TL79_RHIID|nr:hypothetical protein GLOIN_2v1769672 [Rhizophagus irregularis DAOM 181602=DAOM 197198]EXX58831.1 hypothetical protein RirG_194350 [Rhizophagus irregularis DAOM 197198w]UZO20961.1 hypothetical protein OCT59_013370 [Rhizophagus irregularis]POG75864.1 hypothetical protein GLOIN_2v1769672 [Rhizophagus irregularis DAOM 181602=DAOM 197198]CAG8580628.1 10324_t:CDS:1 [Rhizophagus irregularis]GBC27542.2 hypothetical protein GLOIN_2v1769672 [Rhizophagus irregularis DAOM 181602=DAOM 197198]|eukprot:XP_025182730.1 hypothetical protein GLOIN_2v1769672 [Rhizophagus irregularis DAOM 181602=DAOM 197198]
MNYNNLSGNPQLPTYYVDALPTCNTCNGCVTTPYSTGQRHQFMGANRPSRTLKYVLKNVYILSPVEISNTNDVIPEQYVHTPTCNNSQLYMYNPQYFDQVNQQTFQNPPQDIRTTSFPQRNYLKTFDCTSISSSIASNSMMTNINYNMANAPNVPVSQLCTPITPYDAQYTVTDQQNLQNFQNPSHYVGNT